MTSSLSTVGYDAANVPLAPFVTTLSQQQLLQYSNQISLFQKVYAYNSNAYVDYTKTGKAPIYYRFITYQEYTQYKASVALINKLYPFNAMANGNSTISNVPSIPQLSWVVPFPL
jgi:hypothetical protein